VPSGEWWIDDDGRATFADGDVGDMNHEGYAFWSFIGISDEEAPESVSPNGIDLTALGEDMLSDLGVRESIVDVGEWDDEKWKEFLSDNDLDPFDKNEGGYSWSREEVLGLNRLVDLGANMYFIWWWHQSSQQDSREYAIEKKNWIRVQGAHFEMHTFDEDALDRIRGADLWEQEGDPEALEMSEDLVHMNERKTGKFFSVPLKVLFDTSRSYVDIMNYGERGQEGGEEHLALNPGPQIETYSAVGDNMKGILTYDGSVIAWEVSNGGEPHHDDIADLMNIQYVAKMTFDMSRNEMYVDTMSPAFSSVTQSAVRSFTGHSKDTSLLIESGTGRLRTTVSKYVSLLLDAPDPDDYDEGESDAEYEKDTRDYVDRINTSKTYSELYGREKSPEHAEADDPHVHLALNPIKVGDNFIDVNGVKWFIVFMNNIYHIGRHWPDTDTFEWSLALTERDAISKAKIIQRTGKHVGDTMMNPPKFNAALNPPIRVKPESEYDPKELALGIEVEKEHSSNLQRRSITARQHLEEDSHYYTKLKKAGLNPPPKGSPTDLNLWVLDKFFSDKDEVPNRIDPTDVPHLRRCMSAGLIEAVAGPYGKRGGALRLTEKGKQAIREWSLGKNPEDTRVTESNPTMFAYRVHFFDGWNGKNRSMDTTAPSPAKAISNVRYRIAAERGVPLATLPRDMYAFKRVEQLG